MCKLNEINYTLRRITKIRKIALAVESVAENAEGKCKNVGALQKFKVFNENVSLAPANFFKTIKTSFDQHGQLEQIYEKYPCLPRRPVLNQNLCIMFGKRICVYCRARAIFPR